MPDPWEYPWFAAWDLAFHTVVFAHIDPIYAKYQLLLMLREWYMHPNGAIPAYEWNFDDRNPPVHAWAAIRVFEIDGGWDYDFLERVFHKLLDNAVAFSPEGEPIEIAITGDTETVGISVSDHGPGIPDSSRERIFDRFHSDRPAGEEFGQHSGLGLAIARTIAEAHSGSLTAIPRSDGQTGARLVVTLPAWSDE